MSELFLDDDLIQDYLAESREHLANIENDLLTIESLGAAIDEQLVNRVFRAAHSIKGGAGFFNLSRIRDLAHKTENVLDMIRGGQMTPTAEVVSVLLMAFDKLRDMLAVYQSSNEADIGEFLSALMALVSDHLPQDQKAYANELVDLDVPDEARCIRISSFDLNSARKGGRCIYLLDYDLIHDIHHKSKTPLQVFHSLMKSGSIIETQLDLNSAGTLEDFPSSRLILEVLYATVLETDLIGQLAGIPPEQITLIEKNGTAKPLAAPSAESAGQTRGARKSAAKPRRAKAEAPEAEKKQPAVARQRTAAEEESTSKAAIEPKAGAVAQQAPAEATIRLNVALLDSLMTLAGELVLSRNQLNESLSRQDARGIASGAQRVSMVTSELQEVVTLTRMQPVGSVFSKFPRLVRDLSKELGKQVQLQIEGGDVELDKTILEGLSDPLTHMVRNSVDHGIESPEVRAAKGKPQMGTVTLRASHQAGQVVIEIADDGKGLIADKIAASSVAKGLLGREQAAAMTEREKMALIFLPGVSTAEKVSDVSGRGVGMDVVKTNLDKLGGKVEIDSVPGMGATFRIKLPLTLAIIPSLLISDSGQRFAIPQVSVGELIRIPAKQIPTRTGSAGDARVLFVRDRMVPLVRLADLLGSIGPTMEADRAMNVVLVDTGVFEYGLAVGELHDTVEIVVKPLGRHLKSIKDYAGATILGDGRVAVILDVAGLAARAGLTASSAQKTAAQKLETVGNSESCSLLLFHNTEKEPCAMPLGVVTRIEQVTESQIEFLGGRRTMQYRGASLPLVTLHDLASVGELSNAQQWVVLVFEKDGASFGLLAAEPLDILDTVLSVDETTLRQRGVSGSTVLSGRTTLILDIAELAAFVRPSWEQAATHKKAEIPSADPDRRTVLVAEDSDFFRGQIKKLIEAVGFRVMAASDGQAAWEMLDQNADDIVLVATDIEMPRLDGLGLTRQIRADSRFTSLPVIALSSLAGEEEIERGLAAGVTEYQIKLNEEDLVASIHRAMQAIPAAGRP